MNKFYKVTLGIIALLMLMAPVMAFAQVTSDDLKDNRFYIHPIADQLSVGTSVTTYTDSIIMTNSDHHGLYIRTTSAGVVDFDVTIEYSINRESGFASVTTPTEVDTISAVGNKPIKLTNLAFIPFMKFKLVSGATNDASTKVDMFLIRDTKVK